MTHTDRLTGDVIAAANDAIQFATRDFGGPTAPDLAAELHDEGWTPPDSGIDLTGDVADALDDAAGFGPDPRKLAASLIRRGWTPPAHTTPEDPA